MADPTSTKPSQAYVLRERGWSWEQIATELGYKNASSARLTARRYQRKMEAERKKIIAQMQAGLEPVA